MTNVITAKDIEAIIAKGGDPNAAVKDAILTPSAKDALRDYANARRSHSSGGAAAQPAGSSLATTTTAPTTPLNSKSPKADLEAFFNSPYCHAFKEQICAMGHRLWKRAYVDDNGGNMAIRVGDDIAICTPTLVSKGSLQP